MDQLSSCSDMLSKAATQPHKELRKEMRGGSPNTICCGAPSLTARRPILNKSVFEDVLRHYWAGSGIIPSCLSRIELGTRKVGLKSGALGTGLYILNQPLPG